jgi:hypothetical protein
VGGLGMLGGWWQRARVDEKFLEQHTLAKADSERGMCWDGGLWGVVGLRWADGGDFGGEDRRRRNLLNDGRRGTCRGGMTAFEHA